MKLLFLLPLFLSQSFSAKIGILGLPIDKQTQEKYKSEQKYSNMVRKFNEIFIKLSGENEPYLIPYNIRDKDLYPLLDQLDGVYFTGGGVEMAVPHTGQKHPFYVTAEKIYRYVKEKNQEGEKMTLLGICQGFQLILMLEADDPFLLEEAEYLGRSNIDFMVEPQETKMFQNFPFKVLSDFQQHPFLLHLHGMGLTMEVFWQNLKLCTTFLPIAHEEYSGKDLLSVFEAREMPIFGILGHPEMIYSECQDFDIVNNKSTQLFLDFTSKLFTERSGKRESDFDIQKYRLDCLHLDQSWKELRVHKNVDTTFNCMNYFYLY